MPGFVADASATLPWCFEDEATTWSESLLDRVVQGDELAVPAHWMTEVTNALRMAERRGRIQAGDAEAFLDRLGRFVQHPQPPLTVEQAKSTLALSRKYQLTVYDAAYLELAIRLGLEIATLDGALMSAALGESVRLS